MHILHWDETFVHTQLDMPGNLGMDRTVCGQHLKLPLETEGLGKCQVQVRFSLFTLLCYLICLCRLMIFLPAENCKHQPCPHPLLQAEMSEGKATQVVSTQFQERIQTQAVSSDRPMWAHFTPSDLPGQERAELGHPDEYTALLPHRPLLPTCGLPPDTEHC